MKVSPKRCNLSQLMIRISSAHIVHVSKTWKPFEEVLTRSDRGGQHAVMKCYLGNYTEADPTKCAGLPTPQISQVSEEIIQKVNLLCCIDYVPRD